MDQMLRGAWSEMTVETNRDDQIAGVRPTHAVPSASHWPWHRTHHMGVEPGRKPTWNSPETLGANYSKHQTQECPHVCQAFSGANSPTLTSSLDSALHPGVALRFLTNVLSSWSDTSAQAFSYREQILPVVVPATEQQEGPPGPLDAITG